MKQSSIHVKVECARDFAAAVDPYIQNPNLYKSTNCYSYALGIPEAGIAVPGHLTNLDGRVYHYMAYKDKMRELFREDGLIEIGEDELSCATTQVMAVLLIEYWSVHVVKYHQDGTWSHQNGAAGEVTNLNASGHIITAPLDAHKGYDELVGYFKVPEEGLLYIPNARPILG